MSLAEERRPVVGCGSYSIAAVAIRQCGSSVEWGYRMFSRPLRHSWQIAAILAVIVILLSPDGSSAQQYLPTPYDAAASHATMVSEVPSPANSFVGSIGVNTHFTQWPYIGRNEPPVLNLLIASGIRHIRDGMVGSLIPAVRHLAANGVRTTFAIDINVTDATIKSWPGTVGYAFEAYEGPNEPNYLPGDWVSRTRAFMRRLYADVKGNRALAGYPILAPALSKGQEQLGDLGALVDYGNMHDYFDTYNPGTPGWGNRHPPFGTYGSLSYNMKLAGVNSGSKRVMSTETGYGSTPTGTSTYLDDATAAKYMMRIYFVHYNAGVPRTFMYEFLDQDSTGRPFTNNGLVYLNLQPKPSYKALHAIISFLADHPGASFAPTALTYQVTGNLANVRHTLLQKSDGTYYLALWIEVPSWSKGHAYAIPSQQVNIVTHNKMRSASVMQLDDAGNARIVQLAGMPGYRTGLPVTDRISIVKLTP